MPNGKNNNLIFKGLITSAFFILTVVIIWFGSLAPANEKAITCNKNDIAKNVVEIKRLDKEAAIANSSAKEHGKAVVRIDKALTRQTVMLELLLQKEGIRIEDDH
jgi:F0F1-type ATP synthase membrane subunit b/b'